MDHLNWDLSVLSRAVAYGNLSSASAHVGLSQPQLSRIVAKLEEQFSVVLLDRDAKRKSSWTPAAHKMAEIYGQTQRKFFNDIFQFIEGSQPNYLRIGCLEGLISVALNFSKKVLDSDGINAIELHSFDLSELEEKFLKGDLDFVFTSREPGMKKFRYSKLLGYQSLVRTTSEVGSESYDIYSTFQYAKINHHHSPTQKTLISNSLYIREQWMRRFGGVTTLPSKVRAKADQSSDEVSVMFLALDHFPPSFWKSIEPLLVFAPHERK